MRSRRGAPSKVSYLLWVWIDEIKNYHPRTVVFFFNRDRSQRRTKAMLRIINALDDIHGAAACWEQPKLNRILLENIACWLKVH